MQNVVKLTSDAEGGTEAGRVSAKRKADDEEADVKQKCLKGNELILLSSKHLANPLMCSGNWPFGVSVREILITVQG